MCVQWALTESAHTFASIAQKCAVRWAGCCFCGEKPLYVHVVCEHIYVGTTNRKNINKKYYHKLAPVIDKSAQMRYSRVQPNFICQSSHTYTHARSHTLVDMHAIICRQQSDVWCALRSLIGISAFSNNETKNMRKCNKTLHFISDSQPVLRKNSEENYEFIYYYCILGVWECIRWLFAFACGIHFVSYIPIFRLHTIFTILDQNWISPAFFICYSLRE